LTAQSILYSAPFSIISSGAGMNLKVGEGVTRPARIAGKNRFGHAPLLLALQVQLVVLVSAFVMVSTVWCQFILCCSSTHGAPVPSHL